MADKAWIAYQEYLRECDEKDKLKKNTPQKISSHVVWYRGAWETDDCSCGNRMRVPAGKKGVYQCNDCADRAEGLGD